MKVKKSLRLTVITYYSSFVAINIHVTEDKRVYYTCLTGYLLNFVCARKRELI